MLYLACFIIGFAVVQITVATVNLIFRQRMSDPSEVSGLLSILIPARNEEKNMEALLAGLLKLRDVKMEIIVFDDESTDRTSLVVRQFANADDRIRLLTSAGLPKGWMGKNFACHSLASVAKGDYLLFMDADVRITGNLLSRSIHFLKKHRLGMLSIFPKQEMHSFGERMTVPLMNAILLSLLPLILVRKSSFPSLSAANGQYMMFDADTYKTHRPHQQLRNCKVEDIETARLLKKEQVNIACLANEDEVSCRMYRSKDEAVTGFSKNIFMFFGNSIPLTLLFWFITTFGWLVVADIFGWVAMIAYVSMVILTRIVIARVSHQPLTDSITMIMPQQWAFGVIIIRAIRNQWNKEQLWKGRNIHG